MCFFRKPVDVGDVGTGALVASDGMVPGMEDIDLAKTGSAGQAFGLVLALMAACWGGVYILNGKASRNRSVRRRGCARVGSWFSPYQY